MKTSKTAIVLLVALGLLGLHESVHSQDMFGECDGQRTGSFATLRGSSSLGILNDQSSKTRNPGNSESPVKLEISPHFLQEEGGAYREGGPISIKAVFANTGAKPQSIVLGDHDDYSGTRPYPVGIRARVWDHQKNLLTENDNSEGGWWTFYYLSASTHEEKPGDRIRLRPGERVVRIIPLEIVLRGYQGLPNGLLSGKYTVQLSKDGLTSNKIEILIKK